MSAETQVKELEKTVEASKTISGLTNIELCRVLYEMATCMPGFLGLILMEAAERLMEEPN